MTISPEEVMTLGTLELISTADEVTEAGPGSGVAVPTVADITTAEAGIVILTRALRTDAVNATAGGDVSCGAIPPESTSTDGTAESIETGDTLAV